MSTHLLFLFSLFMLGSLYTHLLLPSALPATRFFLSFPIGFVWAGCCGMLILLLGLPYTLSTFLIVLGLSALILGMARRARLCSFSTLRSLSLQAILGFGFITLFHAVALATFTADSYRMVFHSHALGITGTLQNGLILKELCQQGLLSLVGYSFAHLSGADLSYPLHPLFFFSLLGGLLSFLSEESASNKNWKATAPLYLLIAAVFCSTYGMFLQMSYVHNNLISGTFVFFLAASLFRLLETRDSSWLAIVIPSALGVGLIRLEGPVTMLLFIALATASKEWGSKRDVLAYWLIATVLSIWYLTVAFSAGPTDIGSPMRFYGMVGLLIGFGLFQLLANAPVLRFFKDHLAEILVVSLVLIHLVLQIIKPDHMVQSYRSIFMNLFDRGFWSWYWIVSFPLLLLLHRVADERKHYRVFLWGAFCLLLYVAALSALRRPFRLGFGDSANRIFTALIPLTLYYLGSLARRETQDTPS